MSLKATKAKLNSPGTTPANIKREEASPVSRSSSVTSVKPGLLVK